MVWGADLAGGARGACAPVRHSQKRLAPMALLDLFSYACARASTARGWDVCPVEHARRAPPYGHSQKQPCCALSLFHLCSLFYACGVGSVGMIPPRWSTRGVRPLWALAKAAVLRTVSFSFVLTLLRLRRRQCGHDPSPGGARGACAPYGHSQKRLAPMALLDLFSYACARASTANA